MAAPSTGVTRVNSGLAVLDSGGVMSNHPTSSFGYEEAARAWRGLTPPPGPGTGHPPPTRGRDPSSVAGHRTPIRIERNTFRAEAMTA
jgi:hypothetical protein